MERIISIVTLCLLLFVAACASNKNTTKSVSNIPDVQVKSIDTTLFYRKTSCRGTCPVFDFTLFSDQTCEINAKHFYKFEGVRKGTISNQDFQIFVDKVKEIHFFEMENEYDNEYVQDIPATYISVTLEGKSKKIKSRYESPRTLLALQKQIEQLIESVKWEGN